MSVKEIVMWVLLGVGALGLIITCITSQVDRLNWWVSRKTGRYVLFWMLGILSVVCIVISAILNNELLHQMVQNHP